MHCDMNKLVLTTGGVETLEYFAKQMGAEFERLGYAVFYFDLKNAPSSAKKVRKFIKTGQTALVTFNFQGLEQEEGVYKEGIGYLWEEYQMPCYNIAADHPYFYHERLQNLPKKYFHISIDRMHQEYFEKFYPEFRSLGFLPLAGNQFEGSEDACDKTTDVIILGNYTELPFFTPYIHWINDEYAAFYQGIIDELLVRTDATVEEVALEHCEREMGESTIWDLRGALHKMIFIDLYVRNYWRGKAVQTLVDAGVTVDVVGKGWEKLPVKCPENLVIHPQTDSKTCLELVKKAKVSLNVMPWFKDGAHDRVFTSILNGTVCVSDESKYLLETLKEQEGVFYYKLQEIEQLPQLVKRLLTEDELREKAVTRGKEIVEKEHTWVARARKLAEWMQDE